MLFCYTSTGKLDKISAISAIRSGKTGERFGRRAGIRLNMRGKMSVPMFLGLNDMFTHMRRYLVLIITFCISFELITIPLNTINTMRSREMVVKFALDPDSAVYVRRIEKASEGNYRYKDDLLKGMQRVKQEMKAKGYDAELTGIPFYFLKISKDGVVVDMKTDKTQKKLAADLKKDFPQYEWDDAQSLVDQNVGGIQDSLAKLLLPMTGLLCAIIMLITALMEKLFIVREKGEIAMMKSVGFRNHRQGAGTAAENLRGQKRDGLSGIRRPYHRQKCAEGLPGRAGSGAECKRV